MANAGVRSAFVERFEGTWSSLRRAEAICGVLWSFFTLAGGLAFLTVLDHRIELPWTVRAMLLGVLFISVLAVGLRAGLATRIRWSRSRTASEIEHRFPELGQRVRTIVTLAGLDDAKLAAEGVAPGLLRALLQETDERSRPLDIGEVIPWRRVGLAAFICGTPVLLLVGGMLVDVDLQTAALRALLSPRPYATLQVSPGSTKVSEGEDLDLSVILAGRLDRPVVVQRRAVKEGAEWSGQPLDTDSGRWSGPREVRYDFRWTKIAETFEYRVCIGNRSSPTYRVDVLRPLSIVHISVRVDAPEYTGAGGRTFEGGDFHAVEGSQATIEVRLDREAGDAWLVVEADEPPGADGKKAPPLVVPAVVAGSNIRAVYHVLRDAHYSVRANAREGPGLPENRFTIRASRDQPPRLWFEEPDEAMEVHPLAEVSLRVRAQDDFGLSRIGIIFEIDDAEERLLLAEDLAAAPPQGDGTGGPRRTMALQGKLPLEDHRLSPKQSVTYYAFAEDNVPGKANWAESELRFIDIRPFRRIYKVGGT